jgi:hypothetical protein
VHAFQGQGRELQYLKLTLWLAALGIDGGDPPLYGVIDIRIRDQQVLGRLDPHGIRGEVMLREHSLDPTLIDGRAVAVSDHPRQFTSGEGMGDGPSHRGEADRQTSLLFGQFSLDVNPHIVLGAHGIRQIPPDLRGRADTP